MSPTSSLVLAVTATLFCCSWLPASTGAVVFDFVTEDELQYVHYENRNPSVRVREIALEPRFATMGKSSLRFAVPAWKVGQNETPSFEISVPEQDWTAFDRILIRAVNPGPARQKLNVFLTDSTVPVRLGITQNTDLPPFSATNILISLDPKVNPMGANVNRRDMQRFHFYTAAAAQDMEVYIDEITLLKPEDTVPVMPASVIAEVKDAATGQMQALSDRWKSFSDNLVSKYPSGSKDSSAAREWITSQVDLVNAEFSRLEQLSGEDPADWLSGVGTMTRTLPHRLAAIEATSDFLGNFQKIQDKVEKSPDSSDGVAIGFATSMDKILPKALNVRVGVAPSHELAMARGETESFQVVVLPSKSDLEEVTVTVGALKGPDDAQIDSAAVTVSLVGYVQTKTPPYNPVDYIGWWPDPLLTNVAKTAIHSNDAQSFWVRVRSADNQKPGKYSGPLQVLANGRLLAEFVLNVQVFDFEVPKQSPLPIVVNFDPREYGNIDGIEFQFPYDSAPWKDKKREWHDFLSTYYISYSHASSFKLPDFDVLERQKEQGVLGPYSLAYFDHTDAQKLTLEEWKSSTLPRLREAYQEAKRRGLLDQAFFYSHDEARPEVFSSVERSASIVKAEFPDIPILSTAFDASFGVNSELKSIDWFVPLTPKFDRSKVVRAREKGRRIWWYVCSLPNSPPYANFFLECAGIDPRILMGAMTSKYAPEGFLYWEVAVWNKNLPLGSEPFTQWNPISYPKFHGDGMLVYIGPNGSPLPSIRLENFRDGLEDYAYHNTLSSVIASVEGNSALAKRNKTWIKESKSLLVVPKSLVKSLHEYSKDPAALYEYRNRLADAIENGNRILKKAP